MAVWWLYRRFCCVFVMRDESQRTRNQGSESKNDESALSKKKQLEQINIDPFKYD